MTTTAAALRVDGPRRPDRSTARAAWPDAVRVGLTALVVAHHCAVAYALPAWPSYEPPQDGSAQILEGFVELNQAWFMGAFFLISGWFVPGSVDRHGPAGFAQGRLLRLGVPFVAFLLVLKPLYLVPAGDPASGTDPLWWALTEPDPGPLWFVLLLLAFSLVHAGLRAIGSSGAPTGRVPGVVVIAGAGLVLGALSWVWWIAVPVGTYQAVLPAAAYLPQYVLCFVAGTLAGRRQWFTRIRGRTGWACAGLAVPTGLGWLVVTGDPAAAGGGTALSAVAALLNGVFAAAVIVAVLVVARARLYRAGRVARFLSGNAYAVFVLHAPILVWLGVALSGFAAPALVKALVLFAVAAPACWAAAWLVRRIPAVRRIL